SFNKDRNWKTNSRVYCHGQAKKPTKLTLWEDFIDHEGVKLFNQLHDYPIILARRIGKSSSGTSNRFVGLTSKFNTTIEINPPYPQAAELRTWIKTIETKLVAYKMKSTTPIGSIMLIPFEDEVISVANIQAQPPGQVFNVEVELSLAKKSTAQVVTNPHILFLDVNLKLLLRTTTIVSNEIAEKMLHLTSEEIYEICFIKKETLSLQNVEDQLNGKIFNIQMKRLFTKRMDATQKLFILSYLEKQDEIHKPMTSTTVNLEHFCCGSRNGHFLHSFAAAIECRVLQASDVAMWMSSVPLLLWKLKIFSPVIADKACVIVSSHAIAQPFFHHCSDGFRVMFVITISTGIYDVTTSLKPAISKLLLSLLSLIGMVIFLLLPIIVPLFESMKEHWHNKCWIRRDPRICNLSKLEEDIKTPEEMQNVKKRTAKVILVISHCHIKNHRSSSLTFQTNNRRTVSLISYHTLNSLHLGRTNVSHAVPSWPKVHFHFSGTSPLFHMPPPCSIMIQSEMIQEANLSKFKSEVQSSQEHHFSLLQRELEKLRNDIEKMRSELRYEVDKLTAGQRLDLNLERGRIRDELANQNAETTNLTNKLDREIHALRAQIEAAKYEVIKYCIGTLVSISAVGLAVLRLYT
ncbi:hypothetical protein KY289_006937, partial [Solanum tuberosum]